ncbi:ABC transporter permease [Prevotella sp. HJM029]|uniref:ABC transporter permease n=1 Tax=Prevotella sp. HJM029 TaxID=1433844 RepID=UPI00049057ED|nr:ABC transporter permease [Prevotella sp. HJM029]
MKLDIDTYKEIFTTLSRNKSRSFLTGFGVFWGVFMLLGLIGGGNGLQQLLSRNFEGFATNSVIIFAQKTTKPYAGFRKGRLWTMNYDDIERLKAQVNGLDIVAPVLARWGPNATHGDKKYSCNVKGVLPEYQGVETPKLKYGRYINAMDMQQKRKVCVIGKRVYKTLFPNGDNPLGKLIRVDSIYYRVVGVDYASGNISIDGSSEEAIVLPITLMREAYNYGDEVPLICGTAKPGVHVSDIMPKIRRVIAQNHQLDPTDEKGISIFNTEVMFGMVDNLFRGVNFLILLVGIGTILAGAIGVSNIMMVTVKERTNEIGIRRAIGATPRIILGQIIAESIVLTISAGMGGLLFAVGILQLAELASTTDGIVTTHYQIGFWTALGAVALLSTLGVLAGLAPALRAMAIKPVDAMREE